jgi:hypothetical protein
LVDTVVDHWFWLIHLLIDLANTALKKLANWFVCQFETIPDMF